MLQDSPLPGKLLYSNRGLRLPLLGSVVCLLALLASIWVEELVCPVTLEK